MPVDYQTPVAIKESDPTSDPLRPKPLDEDDVQARVKRLFEQARKYDEDDLRPQRLKATNYFLGKKFGNEESGRSQVVMTEVRDTIFSMLPALFRLFFNPAERVVEFAPRPSKEKAFDLAELQTETVNQLFMGRNNGFLLTNAVLEDGLVRRLGVTKTWWEETETVETKDYSGLSDDELRLLAEDPNTEMSGLKQGDGGTWAVQVRRTIKGGQLRSEAIPREEFWMAPGTRDPEQSPALIHATFKTISQLREMGIDDENIREAYSQRRDPSLDAIARDPDEKSTPHVAAEYENTELLYCEGFIRLDVDGDGKAERRRVCTLGDQFRVLSQRAVNRHPFNFFTPYPLAHSLEGLSAADLVMDLQLLESSITRGILDSLSLSLFPRTEVVEGQVNMKDVLNTEIGAIIRAAAPGMIREVTHKFVGADAMPMLAWVEGKREDRTGRARGPDGIDQDALQSTTQEGVQAAVSASRDRLELLGRVVAETFFKPLFLNYYRLLRENQSDPIAIRFRNEWREVRPAEWDEEVDVVVNVALGSGLIEQKLNVLNVIKQSQEKYIELLGQNNPLCGLAELRYTITRALKLSGEPAVERFFKPIDPNNPPPAPPPQPDPATQLAMGQLEIEKQKLQLETMKAQAEAQRAQAQLMQVQQEAAARQALEEAKFTAARDLKDRSLETKQQQIALQHARETQKIAQDAELRREEMALKAQIDQHKTDTDAETRGAEAATEHHTRMQEAGMQHTADLAREHIKAEAARETAALKGEQDSGSEE